MNAYLSIICSVCGGVWGCVCVEEDDIIKKQETFKITINIPIHSGNSSKIKQDHTIHEGTIRTNWTSIACLGCFQR